jgi:hypothetical protein
VTTLSAVRVPLLDDVPLPSEVKPGWIALGLMITLFVVTALLWLSMRKQLGRIRFEEEPDAGAAAPEPPDAERPEGPGDEATPGPRG